jgi:arsenate reductase-like glutaredoxin family protein
MQDLTGSAIGPLVENKIKRNLERNGFIIKYFWNFTSKSEPKIINKKDYIYDYNTYKKIKFLYDNENIENLNMDYNQYYYIVPGSQTNRSLDSVILMPTNNNSFDMIFFQITKSKIEIKKKSEYTKDCFLAKNKFESVYGIKINKLYFYFILAKDFDNQKTKEELESENIEYFYYSILEDHFDKDGLNDLKNLNEKEAEILENSQDNEYQNFKSKLTLINCLEKYLQKKRRLDKNFVITKDKFESGRKHLIKKSSNIILDEENKEQIDNYLKKHYFKNDSELVYKYIFSIVPKEYGYFSENKNIIGIMIHHDYEIPTKRVYKYFYNGKIFPVGFLPTNFLINNYFNLKNNLPKDTDYLISEIPEQYWDKIYVFRIYNGLLTKKSKKSGNK